MKNLGKVLDPKDIATKEYVDSVVQYNDYTLPKATDTSLGGVVVGAGLSIDNGVISVTNDPSSNTYIPLTAEEINTIIATS